MALPSVDWCNQEDLLQLTPSRAAVYQLLYSVPKGAVTTYGAVAEAIGSCGQAVGQACRRNPFYPTVPCYRVVKEDGSLGGLFGETALEDPMVKKKVQFLRSEGVAVKDGKLPDFGVCRHRFSQSQRAAAVQVKTSLERLRCKGKRITKGSDGKSDALRKTRRGMKAK